MRRVARVLVLMLLASAHEPVDARNIGRIQVWKLRPRGH
jgi:hypothetical protein